MTSGARVEHVWSRHEHASIATRALLSLRAFASPGKARFDLPGPASSSGGDSDALEAFARSFVGVGNLLAGQSDDPHALAGWYAEGIAAGVDPNSPEHWPTLVDQGQPRVEAAALAIALHQTRHLIWDHLSPRTQEQVVDWLAGSSVVDYPRCNWVLFHTVTQAFLRSVGAPTDDRSAEHLEFMTACHLGQGWYSDAPLGEGVRPQVDWYNSWVIHHFFHHQARIAPDEPTTAALAPAWRQRLGDWAERAVRLFGTDGAPLFQGRSLTYRFGMLAGFWDAVAEGVGPDPGVVRTVASRTLRHFVDRGSFDDRGLLTLGWHGPHERMRQPYSGPGSPYWAMHGFAGLALSTDHPAWTGTAVEQALGTFGIGGTFAIEGPAWIGTTGGDGIVRVLNHGVDHASPAGTSDPLYDRLAHSTATAPIETDDPDALVDNQVVVIDAAGCRWSQRLIVEGDLLTTRRGRVVGRSRWRTGADSDAPVVTALAADFPAGEIRAVRVDRPGRMTLTGWPIGEGLDATIEPVRGRVLRRV